MRTSYPLDPWQSFVASCPFEEITPPPQSLAVAFSSLDLLSCVGQDQQEEEGEGEEEFEGLTIWVLLVKLPLCS